MEFTTHNNEAIETTGLTAQGVLATTKQELTSLFGLPIGNNFVVKFADGSRALVYPSSADSWYVEGTSKQSLTNLQITLDLYREQASDKFADPVEKAMSPAFDMMASIKANKGEGYAMLLELALLSRKHMELTNSLIMGMVAEEHIPEVVGKGLTKAGAHITSKIIGLGARLGNIDTTQHGAEELMDWVDKLMKLENEGAKSLFKDLDLKGKDD